VILVNQPAESIDADDYTVTPMPGGSRLGRLERQASVRSFFVVVPQVLSEDPLQVALPEDREVAQALAPHCLHAARGKGARLRERSGVGMMRTPSLLNTSARGPANLASRSRMRKRISARRPSIAKLRAGWVTLSRARMGRNAGQVHPPGRELDEKQDAESSQPDGLKVAPAEKKARASRLVIAPAVSVLTQEGSTAAAVAFYHDNVPRDIEGDAD
jgi:hypothetical protein